jgi:hypothetical protein
MKPFSAGFLTCAAIVGLCALVALVFVGVVAGRVARRWRWALKNTTWCDMPDVYTELGVHAKKEACNFGPQQQLVSPNLLTSTLSEKLRFALDAAERLIIASFSGKEVAFPPGSWNGKVYGLSNDPFVAATFETPHAHWLVFRGTQTTYDFFGVDAKVPQTSVTLGGVKVGIHEGFWSLYKRLGIDAPTSSGKPLACTGHSMGAALSLVAAAELSSGSGASVHAYAFACPRAGDSVFIDVLEKLCVEVVVVNNSLDIVPAMPIPVFPNPAKPKDPKALLEYSNPKNVLTFTLQRNSIELNHSLPVYSLGLGELGL